MAKRTSTLEYRDRDGLIRTYGPSTDEPAQVKDLQRKQPTHYWLPNGKPAGYGYLLTPPEFDAVVRALTTRKRGRQRISESEKVFRAKMAQAEAEQKRDRIIATTGKRKGVVTAADAELASEYGRTTDAIRKRRAIRRAK